MNTHECDYSCSICRTCSRSLCENQDDEGDHQCSRESLERVLRGVIASYQLRGFTQQRTFIGVLAKQLNLTPPPNGNMVQAGLDWYHEWNVNRPK